MKTAIAILAMCLVAAGLGAVVWGHLSDGELQPSEPLVRAASRIDAPVEGASPRPAPSVRRASRPRGAAAEAREPANGAAVAQAQAQEPAPEPETAPVASEGYEPEPYRIDDDPRSDSNGASLAQGAGQPDRARVDLSVSLVDYGFEAVPDDGLEGIPGDEDDGHGGFGADPLLGSFADGHGPVRAGESDLPLPEGVLLATWDDLAVPDYEPPSPLDPDDGYTKEDLFPEEVLAFDGKRVAVEGFMLPVDFKGNRVTAFILSPYPPGCCFGGMPGMDEWIDVDVVEERGAEYFAYRTIRVIGAFEVGEELDDYGYVRSIYRLHAETVEKLW